MDSTSNFFNCGHPRNIKIVQHANRWRRLSRPVFISAGLLMLIQVFIIGLHRYGLDLVPEWWAAPPAIGAVVATIFGLITLYSRTHGHANKYAFASLCMGMTSGILLCATALWLVLKALEDGAIPPLLPILAQGAIALFMMTFVMALLLSAAACLKTKAMRCIGLLLLVPVFAWCLILGVAIMSTMNEALKLDVYTNGGIAIALMSVGFLLGKNNEKH